MSEMAAATGTCKNCGKPITFGNYFRDRGPEEPCWYHPGSNSSTCGGRREQVEGTWTVAEPEPQGTVYALRETIHDAVRGALDAIKAQHGGQLPGGFQLRHSNHAPYAIELYCHACNKSTAGRVFLESQLPDLGPWVAAVVAGHYCWAKELDDQGPYAPPEYQPGSIAYTEAARAALADEFREAFNRAGGRPTGVIHEPAPPVFESQQPDLATHRVSITRAATEVTETPKPATRAGHFREAAALLRAYPDYPGVMEIAARILDDHATLPHAYKSLLCQGFDHERCAPEGRDHCKACAAPCTCRCHGERR